MRPRRRRADERWRAGERAGERGAGERGRARARGGARGREARKRQAGVGKRLTVLEKVFFFLYKSLKILRKVFLRIGKVESYNSPLLILILTFELIYCLLFAME